MNHRNLFGIAAVILSSSVFLHSLQPATASMPVGMQHGQFPYEHFTECDLPGAAPYSDYNSCSFTYSSPTTHTLLTVPTDRIFVITGASVYQYYCNFTSDGEPLIGRSLIQGSGSQSGASPLGNGNGHLVIPAGSSIGIHITDTYCPFYLEGYYAHL